MGFYLLSKVVGFLFRSLLTQNTSANPRAQAKQQPTKKSPPNSNVNIEFIPENEKKGSGFSGGEYVDYEEVK